jgi:hypothetical protein
VVLKPRHLRGFLYSAHLFSDLGMAAPERLPAQEGSMTSSIDGPGHVRLSLVGHSGPNLFITSRPEDEAPS